MNLRYLEDMENSATSRETPLLAWHTEVGAKLADFGGWQMPIEYPKAIETKSGKLIAPGGVLVEHHAVRESVGIFDVSHLGKIEVTGQGALMFLNKIFTNDLNRIGHGAAQYNLLCNEKGGVIDDLIVYRHNDEHFFIIPNAANCTAVYQVLSEANDCGLTITNLHTSYGVFAVQGPKSSELLAQLGIVADLDYMHFGIYDGLLICRTGYSGEFGYELIPLWQDAPALWQSLVEAVAQVGGQVCGLGARDTLRTEMGYPLHGHELSPEISPLEAGVAWAVSLAKGEFHGSSALSKQKSEGLKRLSRGLLAQDRGIPRAGMSVLNQTGAIVGVTTSGTFSPTLKQGIGLALLDSDIQVGDQLTIDVRGRSCVADVVKVPFVPSHVR